MKRVVAVVGSREFSPLHRVTVFIEKLAAKYPDAIVISGGARGVDFHAQVAASGFGLGWIAIKPYEIPDTTSGNKEFAVEVLSSDEPEVLRLAASIRGKVQAQWFRSYAEAAFFRNRHIVIAASHVVAFWDGSSPGTANTTAIAREFGKPLFEYRIG